MILNETQEAIHDTVRAFAQEQLRPHSAAYAAAHAFPDSLFEEMGQLGLMGVTLPEAFGGADLDYVSYALALIEIAAGDGALSTITSIQNSLIVGGIHRFGTPAQQQRFLPDLVAGRAIGSFALTEADAGSDAAALRTRAVKVDGGWEITGSKQFISNAKIGKVTIVFAVTDPDAGRHGLSAFLVPNDRAGFSVDKVEHKMGQEASDTCAIRFDKVFVEDELILGELGAGYKIALANLETGRIGIAAQCVGMAQAALEIAVGYAKERKSFGKPIIEHQAVGHRLADLATKLEASRQLLLHAASLKDAGQPALQAASMAKLYASEQAEAIVSGAIQTLGGYGYLEEFGLAKIYRDVRVCQIYEGASDILRMVISRTL